MFFRNLTFRSENSWWQRADNTTHARSIRSLFTWYMVIWTKPPGRPKVSTEKKKLYGHVQKMWSGRKLMTWKANGICWSFGTSCRSLAKSCADWGSLGIGTCSLSLAVQDVKHNSSNKGNWTAQGRILNFSVIWMQFSQLKVPLSKNLQMCCTIEHNHPLLPWTSNPWRLLDLRSLNGIQNHAY